MYQTQFLDIPALKSAQGTVRLPGSKSISNRVLLLSALCQGQTLVHDLLSSDDTHVMLQALTAIGCQITPLSPEKPNSFIVKGIGHKILNSISSENTNKSTVSLFLGNAGTAMRPLVAALALMGGEFANQTFELSGVARMHERPIGDLVDALHPLGCAVSYMKNNGFPPLRIENTQLSNKIANQQSLVKTISVKGNVSSQFLTALLMAMPLYAQRIQQGAVCIQVQGELISKPYIHITLKLLKQFGIDIENNEWKSFTIPANSRYTSPQEIYVESDASSASYFIALGAIAGIAPSNSANDSDNAGVRIEGIGKNSIQGDIAFVDAAEKMGAHIESGENWLHIRRKQFPLKAIDLDCNHIPDAAMTLAMMALYADGTSILRNIASWRVKETDRIDAMATQLRLLGAYVVEGADFIEITPPVSPKNWQSASIHTYDDHRMAMCFSLAAFNAAHRGVRIQDPRCVGKTFPDYFETFFSICTPQSDIPILCIDGPTASGKGTLASEIARRLGYTLLDSGALYRATGLVAQQSGLALQSSNEQALAHIAQTLPLLFEGDQVFLVDTQTQKRQNITQELRLEETGIAASQISAMPKVRAALVQLQHNFVQLPGLVADGRDMGTVIFPHAPLKVFLTASSEKRAQRRYKQLIEKGISVKLDEVCADLAARDARDMNRASAPLKPAPDALLLDNSDLSIEQSVEQVLSWWQQKGAFNKQ